MKQFAIILSLSFGVIFTGRILERTISAQDFQKASSISIEQPANTCRSSDSDLEKMDTADQIVNWKSTSIDGQTVQPFDDAKTRALVLAFITDRCPIANFHPPLLNALYESYAKQGGTFVLLHTAQDITNQKAIDHRNDFPIKGQVVLEQQPQVAAEVAAKVTPAVLVFVRNQQTPAYQGRIDNLYQGYEKKRTKATTADLKEAIESTLPGKTVAPAKTKAVGCIIDFKTPESTTDNRTGTTPAANSPSGLTSNSSTPFEQTPEAYDPQNDIFPNISKLEVTVLDSPRKRDIPILVYYPESKTPLPAVLLSHGLGGTRNTSAYLAEHWAKRGYVVVALQHPGSDDSVWKNTPILRRMAAMKKAASSENMELRTGDVSAALDQLEKWNQQSDHKLFQRMDLQRIGMSGHSFGAVTTQAVAGQRYWGTAKYTDKRIKAALPMSPSIPAIGSATQAFSEIKLPWMCMTGTDDNSPIGKSSAEDRKLVYTNLPKDDKYQLVMYEALHSAFTENQLPGDRQKKNPNHHKVIKSLSTAFWDTYLKADPRAKKWLQGSGPKKLLEKNDLWEIK